MKSLAMLKYLTRKIERS